MEGTQPTGEFWINLLTLGVTSLHLSEPQFPNLPNRGEENSLMGLLGYGETVPRSPGREASWMSPASFSFRPWTFFVEGPQGRQQVRTFPAWPGPCFCTVPPSFPLGVALPPREEQPGARSWAHDRCPNSPQGQRTCLRALRELGLFAAPGTFQSWFKPDILPDK